MIIVAYDIEKDRARNKIAKLLLRYGQRVQFSVFEIECSKKELANLILRIKRLINPEKDSVKFYTICADCESKTMLLGLNKIITYDSAYVL